MNQLTKKSLLLSLAILAAITSQAAAQDLPPELLEALPSAAEAVEDPILEITPPPEDELDSIDPDLYFDTQSLVPTGELSTQIAPRRVNPVVEPASQFVIVTKKKSKDSVQAKLIAAERASKLGRHEAALKIYRDLQERSPRDVNVLSGIAVTLQQLGQEAEAIAAYEDVLDRDPDNLEAHINMLGLVSHKYPAVALQRLQGLQQDNPDSIPLMAQIAFVQAKAGRFEDALNTYATAASIDPKNAGHFYNMGVIADQAGMISDAIKYYEKALDTDTIYSGSRATVPREDIFDRLANLR